MFLLIVGVSVLFSNTIIREVVCDLDLFYAIKLGHTSQGRIYNQGPSNVLNSIPSLH